MGDRIFPGDYISILENVVEERNLLAPSASDKEADGGCADGDSCTDQGNPF